MRCWLPFCAFLLPFFGATGRDSSSTGRYSSSHRTEHVGALLVGALIILSQGVGARRRLLPSARRRLFPSVRISVRAVALCASCEPASRAKPSMRCEARFLSVFYHEASGDKKTSKRFLPRSLGRQEASAYATSGGRGVRAKVEAAANATLARLSARFT